MGGTGPELNEASLLFSPITPTKPTVIKNMVPMVMALRCTSQVLCFTHQCSSGSRWLALSNVHLHPDKRIVATLLVYQGHPSGPRVRTCSDRDRVKWSIHLTVPLNALAERRLMSLATLIRT